MIATDAQSATQSSYEIFPVKLVETDNGAFYEKTQDTPVASMTFENIYTEKAAPAEGDKPAATTKPTGKKKTTAGKIPSTGDSSAPAMECAALLAIAGVLAVGLSMKKLRGGRSAR